MNLSTYFAFEHFIYEGILLIGKQKHHPTPFSCNIHIYAFCLLSAVCDKLQCPIVSACVPFSELTNFIIHPTLSIYGALFIIGHGAHHDFRLGESSTASPLYVTLNGGDKIIF
ncbi:hypothetical protein ACJX0J_026123, partial [Zea mays]